MDAKERLFGTNFFFLLRVADILVERKAFLRFPLSSTPVRQVDHLALSSGRQLSMNRSDNCGFEVAMRTSQGPEVQSLRVDMDSGLTSYLNSHEVSPCPFCSVTPSTQHHRFRRHILFLINPLFHQNGTAQAFL
jgi:hypothetical protein